MKKTFYILSLIIPFLLSLGATVQAQNEDDSDYYQLEFFADFGLSGDFSRLLKPADYNNYLKHVSQIKRVDDKTIILNPNTNAIKVVIDKGRISGRNPYGFDPIETMKSPLELKYWIADNLKENDKNITVSIYDKTNALLGQATYDFQTNVNYSFFKTKRISEELLVSPYSAELHYKDYSGKKQILKLNGTTVLPVDFNYDKPMKIVVYDYWGNKYPVRDFNLNVSDDSIEIAYLECKGEMLSDRARSMLLYFNKININEIAIIGHNGEPCYAMSAIIAK